MENSVQSKGCASSGEEAIYAKVTRRLIPFLFLCYVVSFLDRVNVGFAKLQMLGDLKFSETVYGLGAGLFFVGYFMFEVPSNIILSRTGARVWIARIMVTWGIVSAAMMFVTTPGLFYTMRFLLGVAEAGFFPGVILYLTYWYPARRRARIVALFMTGIAFAGVIGSPLSGWIMKTFSGMNGWTGWQWLFLLEGIPSVIVGIWVLFYLDDSIRAAQWLPEDEKQWLEANIHDDQKEKLGLTLGQVFANGRVWLLACIYFSFIMGLYGVGFWLPQLIKGAGVNNILDIGLLTAVPYGIAAIAMVMVSRSSDVSGERRWHTAGMAVAAALGIIVSALYGDNTVIAMAALSVATAGVLSTLPLFWTLPTGYLTGAAAAAGIAIINSVGNLAGFVSPFMMGVIKDATQSTADGMYVIAACLFTGALLVVFAIPKNMGR
ncbi:MAG: MFS transporter [Gallionellaceae bacterium]|nr:MFS transporter [Gallionellaceae bacterium]